MCSVVESGNVVRLSLGQFRLKFIIYIKVAVPQCGQYKGKGKGVLLSRLVAIKLQLATISSSLFIFGRIIKVY